MTAQTQELWFTLGVDPKKQRFEVLGFANNKRDCIHHRMRSNYPHVESFCYSEDQNPDVRGWLLRSGVQEIHVDELLRFFVEQANKLFPQ